MLHQILEGGVKQSHTNLIATSNRHMFTKRTTNINMIKYSFLIYAAVNDATSLSAIQNERSYFTWISASNSSLLICGFSVTSMPFSCSMILQHGSTLSLIKMLFTETGAIISHSHSHWMKLLLRFCGLFFKRIAGCLGKLRPLFKTLPFSSAPL